MGFVGKTKGVFSRKQRKLRKEKKKKREKATSVMKEITQKAEKDWGSAERLKQQKT